MLLSQRRPGRTPVGLCAPSIRSAQLLRRVVASWRAAVPGLQAQRRAACLALVSVAQGMLRLTGQAVLQEWKVRGGTCL